MTEAADTALFLKNARRKKRKMASSYGKFALFYDRLTQNVEYKKIALLCDKLIKEYSTENEVVLDLACGTGSLSEEMARLGYDVFGVDLSEEMLEIAMDKRFDSGLDIQYLCQDMTKLDLYGAVDAVICVLDSLNHLNSVQDFRKTVERVSMFTCDGGVFIFDVNTLYKHREILGDNAYNYALDGLFCAWQNERHEDGSVSVYLDFFEEEDDGRYSRYSESFKEIIIPESEIKKALAENDFELIGQFDDFSENSVNDKTQRILYIAKRKNRTYEV
ncbi:MAG: class I SAM-dependent DNA methyltransferase [Hominimerdicola sp.]